MILLLNDDTVPEELIFSPLSNERINQLASIAEQLAVEPDGRFMIRSQQEAFEVLRFHASVMSGCVCGYEQVEKGGAVTLLMRSIWDESFFNPGPYLITKKFEALCFHQYASQIVEMAIRYKDVLLRPYLFPRFCRTMEEALCILSEESSRLAYGLSRSIRNGGIEVLTAFFSDADARKLVDNLFFVNEILSLLMPNDRNCVVDLFNQKDSTYADTLIHLNALETAEERWFYDREQDSNHSATTCFFDEQQLIEYELQNWCRFYDDRGVILNAIPFVRQAELPQLLRIYHNDPLVVAAVVKRLRNC